MREDNRNIRFIIKEGHLSHRPFGRKPHASEELWSGIAAIGRDGAEMDM